jgi:hypothetical protein
VHAVDLDAAGTTATYLAKYQTAAGESSGLAFDASINRLFILHNIGGNSLEVTDLSSITTSTAGMRRLTTLQHFSAPNGSNLEGFAVTPALSGNALPVERWAFWVDDDGTKSSASGRGLFWFRQLPTALNTLAGDGQTAAPGAAVTTDPAVRITDDFGNPLPGITVTFTADGGGAVAPSTVTTDVTGTATVTSWTLGGTAGSYQLTANVANANPASVTFSAIAMAAIDTTAPEAVTLAIIGTTPTSLTLGWSAPHEDGATGGAVSGYLVRIAEGTFTSGTLSLIHI